ncbi:MAG TPA: DUF6299 family protein [Candidatus Limnocylindria bacterium]|nr:DUF6299 family protein [Candidatus Limnocylindria bacterium]
MRRATIATCLVTIMSLVLAAPALAAAPTNDTYAGRTILAGLPFSETLDTTEATTDADDVAWNTNCGAPATEASVWYELTAATDGGVIVDVTASDYSAGIAVVTGSPGSFVTEACGPGIVGFFAGAGTTYQIVAFDDTPGGTNGGMLSISIEEAPPPPEVEMTVDRVGHFDSRSGSATITGTITCSGETEFTSIDVQLRQRVGRLIINGFGSTDFACDGTTHDWSVEVIGDNGVFKGGKAATVVFGVACGAFDCGEASAETTVQLKG